MGQKPEMRRCRCLCNDPVALEKTMSSLLVLMILWASRLQNGLSVQVVCKLVQVVCPGTENVSRVG